MKLKTLFLSGAILLFGGCTQETQNSMSRSIQNWTGTDGVLDIYAGDKLVHKFIKIDKVSTAYGSKDGEIRPYRYGYGIDDLNFNGQKDEGEKKVYFDLTIQHLIYFMKESKEES